MSTSVSVRSLACEYLESIFSGSESTANNLIEALSVDDRGLFQELTQGVLKEWKFLEWVVSQFAKKKPARKLEVLLQLSTYQFLFLDRIPAHAIYSEAKKIAQAFGASGREVDFLHGVLKKIESEKSSFLTKREQTLARFAAGAVPQSDGDWAVLGCAPGFLDALTVIDGSLSTREAYRSRAVKALCAMKKPAELVGYALPGRENQIAAKFDSLMSRVAPRAMRFFASPEFREDLAKGRIRIQGEASQYACEIAAKKIQELIEASGGKPITVLELSAGKGGKTISTLAALSLRFKGRVEHLRMNWYCIDPSASQRAIFSKDALPLVHALWPSVNIQLHSEVPTDLKHSIDFVWIDAPCTGFGTLAKLPEIVHTRGADAYASALEMATIQQGLIEQAREFLKTSGGRLFYTVCTLTHPETLKIASFCEKDPSTLVEIQQSLWPGSGPAPQAEGFYLVLVGTSKS